MKTFLLKLSCLSLLLGMMIVPVFAQGLDQNKRKTGLPVKVVPSQSHLPIVRFNANQQIAKATPFSPISVQHSNTPINADVRELVKDPATDLPIFFKADVPQISFKSASPLDQSIILAYQFLTDHKAMLKIDLPNSDFEVSDLHEDHLGMQHVKMAQYYQGLPVYGGEVYVHVDGQDEITFTGRYQPSFELPSIQPQLTEEVAIQAALADVSQYGEIQDFNPTWQKILDYTGPKVELIVFTDQSVLTRHRLAYHITVRPNVVGRYEYFVDANTGDILSHFDHTCHVGPTVGTALDLNNVSRSLGVFEDTDGTFYMLDAGVPMFTGSTNAFPADGSGFILTADMNNTPITNPSYFYLTANNANSWSKNAVSAHYNARVSYDYFRTTFNRSSINGQGGDIISFINVADDNGGGLDNAFWNGQAMFYGSGDQAFSPLAGALDVGGHEMSHGVIQETANLEYQGQSGALNESFADIFGVMIEDDPNDWQLGEDVTSTQFFPTGALRDMANPNNGGNSLSDNGWQPDHMDDIYTGTADNGGVHINSGIVNRAYYLYATAIGRAKAEQVFYRALTTYLTRSSQFLDGRFTVIKSAEDLHGVGSNEANQAASAFDQVGILDPNGGSSSNGGNDYEDDLNTNPGAEFIISNDVNPSDINTWYISDTSAQSFAAVSTRSPQTRISVTDNGQFGYFVGEDKHIYRLTLDANNPSETQLSSNPEWDNVAVSKDGSRLAAITTSIDTSIYVFNLTTNPISGTIFKLYNPTTATGGVNSGGVLYADAISWDVSGEYILYDALNRIPNSQGADLEYWDVGLLRAWDNASNSAGDGFIVKLFTNLPEGFSLGNAEFSKNSPYIIAFDYFNQVTQQVDVLGANIERGEVGTLVSNNPVLGYPSFSNKDTKVLLNDEFNNNFVLSVVDLQTDKINAQAAKTPLINFVRFGTWYATGSRDLSVSVGDVVEADGLVVYPNPSSGLVSIDIAEATGEYQFELINLQGQQIWKGKEHVVGGAALQLDLSKVARGSYFLNIHKDDESWIRKLMIQ
ncbi:MAG: M4 family metallopeptidase [Bacteroidota bacterium]